MEGTETRLEGNEQKKLGWRNHIFKIPSVMAFVVILSVFIQSPLISYASIFCFIGVAGVFIFSVGYSVYYHKRDQISTGYLLFSFLSFFFVWALSSAFFLASMMGGFEWGHIGVVWENDLFFSVISNGLSSSGVLIIMFFLCFMVAFKSKRRPRSILNAITYWSLIIAFYISIEPVKQLMYPAM